MPLVVTPKVSSPSLQTGESVASDVSAHAAMTSPETKSGLSSLDNTESSQAVMSFEEFSAFLLSPDNSPVADQDKTVWHDMTRPLCEYYISSSHNTYLVGNQLVGVSTIEGYIRALLHSCRSVERESHLIRASAMSRYKPELQWTSMMGTRNQSSTTARRLHLKCPYAKSASPSPNTRSLHLPIQSSSPPKCTAVYHSKA
jgi:hypothetical protein